MKRKTPMPQVSRKRADFRASPEGMRGKEHMAKVASLPCVICHEWSMTQLSRTQVHHCIHGRYSARKASDTQTIPLCEGHHQGLIDTSKTAIHQEPSKWKRLFGEDTGWLTWVDVRLGKDTP